jgi:hypothetical protein
MAIYQYHKPVGLNADLSNKMWGTNRSYKNNLYLLENITYVLDKKIISSAYHRFAASISIM